MEGMVTIMKKNKWFGLVALIAILMLSGCKHDEPEIKVVPEKMEIGGSLYDKYGLGVEVDLSDAYVNIIYNDNSEKKYSVLSNDVTYDEFDTSTVGSKVSTFRCEGLSLDFNYEVVKYCLTLDFLDGTYDNATSYSIDAYNNRVAFSNIIPTPNDSQMQFAGWFYDKDLTKRVATDIEDECKIDDNITFYAGYDKNYDENFEYLIKNDCVILTGYKFTMDFNDTITIPKTIKLYSVIEIGDNFIDEMTASIIFWINKIDFEEGSMVKKIGKEAFENLSLTEVYLPDSIEIIDDRAFYNCQFTSLKLPKNLRKIGAYSFASLFELLTVDFNDCALTTIGDGAFSGCSKLVDIKLPDHVDSIGSSAFEGCAKVIEFSIPKSVSIIGVNVFSSMPSLEKIVVEEGNMKFSTIDGNLYNKEQTIFYRYCYGKTETNFTLPASVKIIFESAFDIKNEICSLKNVYLNEGLEEIASHAFQNTSFDFTIPSTLKSFAADSFVNWSGKTFKINENNPNFKVVNSSLVSYDGTILYSVPANYDDGIYVIPDSIKTINSYAISALNNVSVIKIGKDSNLNLIKEYGITPFSLNELIYIVIEKQDVFSIVDNGLKKSDEVALNKSFSIIVDDQIIDKYLSAWDGYHFYEEDELPLTYYVKTPNDFLYEIVDEIGYKMNVTSFEAYQKYDIFMIYDNFNEVFFNGKDVLKKISAALYLNGNAYKDYDNYFTAFINTYAKRVLDYFESLSLEEFGSTKYYFKYLDDVISSQISAKLTESNLALYEKNEARYNDMQKHRNQIVEDMMDYELSKDSFDIEHYNQFITEYNKYCVANMSISNSQLFKYFMIDFSYKMYQLSTVEYNYQNASYLNNLLNGNLIENIYGINDYLLYYFNQDAYTINLYKFDELAEITENVYALINETTTYIDNEFTKLDVTFDYDATKYQELLNLYNYANGFEFYLSDETINKYQFVKLRIFANEFIDLVNNLSKANMFEATITTNNIQSILANNSVIVTDFENCSEYSTYSSACEAYDAFFNETCNEFEAVLFAIDSDNITEKFDELKALYDAYPDFIALLSYSLNEQWVPMLTKYESIVCAKYIKDAVSKTKDTGITKENYVDIFNLCFGYNNVSHINGIEDLLNKYKNDGYFSEFLNEYIDSTIYIEYMEILNQL